MHSYLNTHNSHKVYPYANENVTSTHFRNTMEYSNTGQLLCLHNKKKYH